jgi:hypothetical protein
VLPCLFSILCLLWISYYIPNVQRAVSHINMTGRNVITLVLMQIQIYKEMTYALCPFVCLFVWWCLTPLSTIFQLYRGGTVLLVEKTTDLSQVTDKLFHIMLCTSPWSRFELTTSVVIGTGCICSCISNYHTITATTAPLCVSNRIYRLLNERPPTFACFKIQVLVSHYK